MVDFIFAYLKHINSRTGEVTTANKLFFPYAEKIKVKDGYAWYVYRPFESLQARFLYKEKLTGN